jgi:uncharacterized membrane protein YwaF
MENTMREFFGFGGYQREPEGYFSWQHLAFVTCFMVVMVTAAILLGNRNRSRSESEKNKVLIWAAILIDAFEIFKIVIMCIRGRDPMGWITELPLFLCSIQLITIPLAAFSKGRVKEAALDFVFIFGILGAVLGTYLAGNNYGTYPVLSFDNTVSAITHSISGFASLYIVISDMESMKKKNIPITFAILLSFCVMAYTANVLIPYNYMFLMRGDGTPYDIVYNLVGGNRVLYPMLVVIMFLVYICAFWGVFTLVKNKFSGAKKEIKSDDECNVEITANV